MDSNPYAAPETPQTDQRDRNQRRRWLGRLFLAIGFGCNALIFSGSVSGSDAGIVGFGLMILTVICIIGSAIVYWRR